MVWKQTLWSPQTCASWTSPAVSASVAQHDISLVAKKYNLANSSQRFTYINMKQTFNSGLYFVLHGIMMLHKQLNFEVLSWEVFNIPEICTSGVSFTCVSDYTISKL